MDGRLRTGLGLAVLSASALAACSGSTTGPPPTPAVTTGTLRGTAMACIGPALPPGRQDVSVTVDISKASGQLVIRRTLRATGNAAYGPIPFSLTLPAGRYSASTPADGSKTVEIAAGGTSSVELTNACI